MCSKNIIVYCAPLFFLSINLIVIGMLRCSTFSYVSLEGKEIERFMVPGMKGGLFVSCSEDGSVLISDVVKKSVFLLKDGNVLLEICTNQFLKVNV